MQAALVASERLLVLAALHAHVAGDIPADDQGRIHFQRPVHERAGDHHVPVRQQERFGHEDQHLRIVRPGQHGAVYSVSEPRPELRHIDACAGKCDAEPQCGRQKREPRPIAWIKGDGALAQRLDLVHLFEPGPADRLPGAQPQLVRRQALDGTGGDAAGLVRQDGRLDAARHRVRHVVLEGEGVLERAVEPLGPHPLALRGSRSCTLIRTRDPERRTLPSSR